MSLQSIGGCPWCGASIDMKKNQGAFECPVCNCRFLHNWKPWVVGIPIAVVAAYAVFHFLHIGTFAAFSGALVAITIVKRMGLYRVLVEGKPDVAGAEVAAHVPEKKESRWAIIFMVLLLLAIAVFFVFALK